MTDRRSSSSIDRVYDLASICLSGDATPEEQKQLEELLDTDGEARRAYFEFIQESSLLAVLCRPEQSADQESRSSDTPGGDGGHTADAARENRVVRVRKRISQALRHEGTVGIVVAIVFAAVVLSWAAFTHLPEVTNREDQPAEDEEDEVVAWLANTHGVKWADGGVPDSTRYKAGQRLAIEKGLVEIHYATGARVVIEGPAEFVVGAKDEVTEPNVHRSSFIFHPSNSGYLALGRLVARCDTPKSQGFAIDTPFARIEDLGTEFGVEVFKSGAAEFVVLSGKVDVVHGPGDGPEQRVRLVENQGVSVAPDSQGIERHSSMDPRSIATYRARLETDFTPPATVATRGLAVYYRADNVDGQGNAGTETTTTVVNLASPGTHDGTIVDGSGVMRNSEQVGTPFEYGVVLSAEKQTHIAANTFQIAGGTNRVMSATWEFWLKADAAVLDGRGALYGEFPQQEVKGTRHYLKLEGIGGTDGRMRFDEYQPEGGSSVSDSRMFDTDGFTQVVATKRGDILTFYRNGEPFGATKSPMETYSGDAVVQTLFGKRPYQNESFDGQFNIIRIYDRALNSEQVNANYRAEVEKATETDNVDRESALLK